MSIRVKGELDMAATPALTEAIVGAGGSRAHRPRPQRRHVPRLVGHRRAGRARAARSAKRGSRLEIGPRSDIVTRVLEITGLDESSEAFDVLPGAADR